MRDDEERVVWLVHYHAAKGQNDSNPRDAADYADVALQEYLARFSIDDED